MSEKNTGRVTIPTNLDVVPETIELMKRWGADAIRDCDGTEFPEELTKTGAKIYATYYTTRKDNAWAKANPDEVQQSYIMTNFYTATGTELQIPLMKGISDELMQVNTRDDRKRWWEVIDRSTGEVVSTDKWEYNEETGCVCIHDTEPFHEYTVSFLAYRIWEEISMYNHITNNWAKEHLIPIDPVYAETQVYLINWMKEWCEEHPATTVVRFTSMFYNFVWIWGSDARKRNLFTDWGSYDFTVSPLALHNFEQKYGYALTAEDFVNQGKYQVTHMPPTKAKKDWMEFINDFVISFGKKLIDIVHEYGKKAYVFYDDSWVGIEPYNDRFSEFGFDGIIK